MYKDPHRNEPLVEIEIVVRDCQNLLLPSAESRRKTVGPGKHRITVYESDYGDVEAMVEQDKELLVQADKMYANRVKAAVRKANMDGLDDDDPAKKEFIRLIPDSPQGCFNVISGGRDAGPLDVCKIIKDGILPRAAKDPMADAVAQSLETMIPRIVSATITALKGDKAAK